VTTYLIWLIGPVLQVLLLIVMVRRKLQQEFPRFFSYILLQPIKSVCLFIIYRFYPDQYFGAYWVGNAISVLLSIAVMDEVLNRLFEDYGTIQSIATVVFRWACVVCLVVAVVGILTTGEGVLDHVETIVMSLERSARLLQCGLFLLVMFLAHSLRSWWRRQAFGIALGFGIFASIEALLMTVALNHGSGIAPILSTVKSLTYNAITVVWIFYAWQQVSVPVQAGVNDASFSTVPTGVAYDQNILNMAEKAVERILARGSWPRPSVKGSWMVARKPESEDQN